MNFLKVCYVYSTWQLIKEMYANKTSSYTHSRQELPILIAILIKLNKSNARYLRGLEQHHMLINDDEQWTV